MKNIKVFKQLGLLLLTGIVSVMSWNCSDEFLESVPQNDLSAATFYKTADDFEKAVNGIYRTLAEREDGENNDEFRYLPMADCGTQYAGAGKSRFDIWEFNAPLPNSTWRMTSPVWRTYFRMVNRSNVVLKALETAPEGIDQNALNQFKGEALFLRALAYFYLTDFYGDVPLHTAIPTVDEAQKPRTPKSEVINQVVTDLTDAIALLPSVTTYRGNANLGRASRGAAQGLLGKVFVFEERYAEAKTVLKTLIDSGDYQLMQGPAGYMDQFWPPFDNNAESLFEVQYNLIDGNNYTRFCTTGPSAMHVRGFRYVAPTQDYLDKFETVNGFKVASTYVEQQELDTGGAYSTFIYASTSDDPAFDPAAPFANRDPRLKWSALYEDTPYVDEFMERTGQTGVTYKYSYSEGGNYANVKYMAGNTYDLTGEDSASNFKILRYADVLLLYAEALLEGDSDIAGAATYINRVRSRESVNMPDVPMGTLEEMRTSLRDERIRELAFEYAHIYQDLRRWGTWEQELEAYWTPNKNGGSNAALTLDPIYSLWPIPQNEIDTNPELTQNPGY